MKKIACHLHLPIIIAGMFAMLLFFSGLKAQPISKDDKRLEWWRNAKFGMFIHWGLYAVPAGEYKGGTNYGEWIMQEAQIPKEEYEKFGPQFNPLKFNADEWVSMAKNAGMKYIVITSKHHDGFCLWDSKVSDYDVMDRTPFKRDIMKELSDACKKQGIVFCMYHSIMDWHHPDENKTNIAKYREEYLKPQLKELVTKYDPGVLWFDGEWVEEWTEEQGQELYDWLRQLKPGLIINNRIGKGRNGMQGMSKGKSAGDFGTPEQEILDTKSDLDWESCMTMNDHWGYNKNDHNWKTTNQLIWNLVDVVAKGGNYLLNVGPTREGVFPDVSIDRLREIGEWTKINSEAIYHVKTWDYFQEGDNIRFAQNVKGETFIYVNGWPGKELIVRKIKPVTGSDIQLLGSKEKLGWKQTSEGLVISLPLSLEKSSKPTKQVYVFKLRGVAQVLAAMPQIGTDAEMATKTKVIAGNESTVTISSAESNAKIYYTTDGSIPTLQSTIYSGPIVVNQSGVIKAVAYVPGKMPSDISELKVVKGKYAVNLNSSYASQYAAMGPVTLVDGWSGDVKNFHKGWLGFEGKDMEAIIDLGTEESFSKVNGSFLRNHGAWIFLPVKMKVFTSADGSNYQLLGEVGEPIPQQQQENERKTFTLSKSSTARYIKVVAEGIHSCPSWHAGNGGKAWLFADELSVE
ncbi:alpha-L-fucosidase [Terrimonas pollutisoli]|uniref:alpha-L-fucosidase n=1 Tax=Terrimonas pollutisoli TaxID=3034147 RepID=UPI0023ED79CB|nr:alpha-L-fucosidase [Terrimonas sp. H1YJ31]